MFCFQSYLNTFAFKNTVVTNLWDHLQQVSGCTYLPSHTRITFLSFSRQPGTRQA